MKITYTANIADKPIVNIYGLNRMTLAKDNEPNFIVSEEMKNQDCVFIAINKYSFNIIRIKNNFIDKLKISLQVLKYIWTNQK